MKAMKDITNCVICDKRLKYPRKHVDTCGERCYKKLLNDQRMFGYRVLMGKETYKHE